MSINRDAFEAATGLVVATWADVTKIYRPNVGTWMNWLEEIEDGNLVLPFAVIAPMGASPVDGLGSANRVFQAFFEVYYVRSANLTASEKLGANNVQHLLEDEAAILRDAFFDYAQSTFPNQKFQVMRKPSTDCSDTNPANAVFLSKPYPYWSAMVRAELTFGETNA